MSNFQQDEIELWSGGELPRQEVLSLYRECGWSAVEKPDQLLAALKQSHTVISAWQGDRLLGLGNAISDGSLVVYYPHLLVRPAFQRQGIGRKIMLALQHQYVGFHQQILLAVDEAMPFYQKCGFRAASGVSPLWLYDAVDI